MADPRHTARWQRVAAQAYERDMRLDAVCHICLQAIDYTLESPHPDAYEADHFPYSVDYCVKNGLEELCYDLGNVAPSHVSCNRSTAGKTGTYDIGSPSRRV